MVTAELKSTLHRMVDETNDPLILKQVASVFSSLRDGESDWWDLISDAEKVQIEAGYAQAVAGKKTPHTVVREKAKVILKRKKASE